MGGTGRGRSELILTDVNVLVYAFRREAPEHASYSEWLAGVVAGSEELALHEAILAAFLRITTNPRIVGVPAPADLALEFVDRLVAARRARWLSASALTWQRLRQLVSADLLLRANLVPDAYVAALAIVHGCRLATADRGFARFPGLAWFDPVRRHPPTGR